MRALNRPVRRSTIALRFISSVVYPAMCALTVKLSTRQTLAIVSFWKTGSSWHMAGLTVVMEDG